MAHKEFFKQHDDEYQRILAESWTKANVDRLFPKSGIHYRYSNARISDLHENDEKQQQIKQELQRYVENFRDRSANWLLFLGKKGTGKTYAACAVCNELMENGIGVKYVSLPKLLMDIKNGYSSKTNVLEEYLNIPFLVIDELATKGLSDDEYRNLFVLVDERYAEEYATVFISNTEKISVLGESILDRILELVQTMSFNNTSLRQDRSLSNLFFISDQVNKNNKNNSTETR